MTKKCTHQSNQQAHNSTRILGKDDENFTMTALSQEAIKGQIVFV